MYFIDTHTHLFSEQFDEDRNVVVQQAIDQGVKEMYLPNIAVSSLEKMKQMHQDFPANCFPMAGLHPSDVKENYKQELETIREWINENQSICYGIGETGLDYYWDKTFIEQQKDSLRTHAKWAKELDLPIILHTRDSFEDNVNIMQEEQDGSLKGIFHCFSGTVEEAKQVIDLGFLMGIGGVLTFKNSGADFREVAKDIPMKYFVLETDSPYLTPHPNRGKRNESSYIPLIAQKLAEVKEISIEEIAEETTKNAQKLFRK